MIDANNITILDKYLCRVCEVLADSFNVDVRTLKYNEVSKFAADYLRKDTMPSTCALDYYNKYLAKSTEDLRYSNDNKYDKFLHSVADHLETGFRIDKRKLAEFNSFPQKCFEHYSQQFDSQWTAIDFYNSCSGDEIEYMLLKPPEYSHDKDYNSFLNKVADLLEKKCSIDKTKLPSRSRSRRRRKRKSTGKPWQGNLPPRAESISTKWQIVKKKFSLVLTD